MLRVVYAPLAAIRPRGLATSRANVRCQGARSPSAALWNSRFRRDTQVLDSKPPSLSGDMRQVLRDRQNPEVSLTMHHSAGALDAMNIED